MSKNRKLYDMLAVDSAASQKEITKAFRLRALRLHPDKNMENQKTAAEFFVQLKAAYDVLRDPEKRKIYDETGIEFEESDEFEEAYEHFRGLYPKIFAEDIDKFEKEYRSSDMEEEDLRNFYNKYNGDISLLLQWIPFSGPEDINRYLITFQEMFDQGSLKKTAGFEKSLPKLRRNAEKWKKNSEKELKDLKAEGLNNKSSSKDNSMNDLILSIQKNQKKRVGNAVDLLNDLENKYTKTKKKNPPPSEEEFQEARKRLSGYSTTSSKTRKKNS